MATLIRTDNPYRRSSTIQYRQQFGQTTGTLYTSQRRRHVWKVHSHSAATCNAVRNDAATPLHRRCISAAMTSVDVVYWTAVVRTVVRTVVRPVLGPWRRLVRNWRRTVCCSYRFVMPVPIRMSSLGVSLSGFWRYLPCLVLVGAFQATHCALAAMHRAVWRGRAR